MKNIYFFIFMLSSLLVTAQSNITFSVDMTGQTFTQAYVSGSFNGWSGDANPLTDMGGGIWEVTLPLTDGEYEYKFTYDNWFGQDMFTQGDVCTITNYGNTNRRLVVSGADQTLPTVSFGNCASSGGTYNITFNIDMSTYSGSFGAVQINGENHNGQGFGAWCGTCAPTLTNTGGSIYSITIPLQEYAYQFKFTIDGWNDQEYFSPGDPQTSTDGTFTNRYIQVDQDKTVDYVWSQPQSLNTDKFEVAETSVYPNPSKNNWNINSSLNIQEIEIYNVLGKKVISKKVNKKEISIDASQLSAGLYIAKIKSGANTKTIKLIKE